MSSTTSPVCLIGEPDTFLARLLMRFCEACGLAPVRAQVGEELVALAEALRPDLIILDVELPGDQRGWEAVQALRLQGNGSARPGLPGHTPVVSCSWLSAADAAALVPGCAAYLQKPDLHYDDFVRAVSTALKDAGFEPARD